VRGTCPPPLRGSFPMNLDWLNSVLPLLRCPDTHQGLRWATPEELARLGTVAPVSALARADGSRLFLIDDGIPNLLPQDLAGDAIAAGQAPAHD
jgi:uncharacterized protein YbaR (Trm112 family)